MASKWYDSKIIKILDQSTNTKRFFVKISGEEILNFKAGQFITMELPIHIKKNKCWRSYSIANAPDGTNILEFTIVLLEGGLGTTYLFNDVKIGDNIRFKGPSGKLVLPETIHSDLVFICTGTGVAPFRSMLWDILNKKKSHQKIHLIFGTRYEVGLLYRDEMEEFTNIMDSFSYSTVLSREEKWDGHKGYVHPIYLEDYKTVRPDVHFYLCGWTVMVDSAVDKLLNELGYPKSQIHFELYG